MLSFFIFVFALFHAIQNWDAKLTKKKQAKRNSRFEISEPERCHIIMYACTKIYKFPLCLVKIGNGNEGQFVIKIKNLRYFKKIEAIVNNYKFIF